MCARRGLAMVILAALPGCLIMKEIARSRADTSSDSTGDNAGKGGGAPEGGSGGVGGAGQGSGSSGVGGAGQGGGSSGAGGAGQGGGGGDGGAPALLCWFDAASEELYCAGAPAGDGVSTKEVWEYGFYPTPGYQFPAYESQGPVSWYNCLDPAGQAPSKKVHVRYWLKSAGGSTAPASQWIDCR